MEAIDLLTAEISALDKLDNIINYFSNFPLLGVKRLDFKDWISVHMMIKNKEHLTELGRLRIKY